MIHCVNASSSFFAGLFGSPPAAPVPVDWDGVESWLGLSLPGDYKALATTYGPLDIGEFVWLHTPCVQEGRFDYGDWLRSTHRQCRIASRNAPPYEPPAFHPMPGGLLAWGMTRSSTHLFWDTAASEDPGRWPVVVYHRDAGPGVTPWRTYQMSMSELLSALVSTGIELPGGKRLGPLPAAASRTAFLPGAAPWDPPAPQPQVGPERRRALTEGTGPAALSLLLPPVETPYLGDGTWERLFEALGTRLPTEYVALMDRYGAGCWSNWLRFFTPLRTGDRGFELRLADELDTYRELHEDYPEDHPRPPWPEPGGFLPFANSIDGDQLGWLAEGDPDDWPLFVVPRHADPEPPLPGNLTDTLLEWLRGRLTAPGFAEYDELDDPLEFIGFEPWDDKAYW
jgi:hypothetical protein